MLKRLEWCVGVHGERRQCAGWIVAAAFLVTSLGLARSAAAEGVPAWCATEGVADLAKSVRSLDNALGAALQKDSAVDALHDLVIVSCAVVGPERADYKDFTAHHDDVVAARQYWNKQLDMTDADWADVADWAQVGKADRSPGLGTLTLDTEKQPWSSFTPLQQYLFIAGRAVGSDSDIAYWADALDSKLSELGRLAFIEQCLEGSKDANEVRWAVCQPDIAVLDPGKLANELRAAKDASGYQRTIIRLDAARIRASLPKHAEDVKALIAKDGAYGKVFQVAAAARKAWNERIKPDSPLVALALAMDDARISDSRKAYDGCDEKTWSAWKAAVAKTPAKTFENMHDRNSDSDQRRFISLAIEVLEKDPEAYLAALAFATCTASQADNLGRALVRMVGAMPGLRGPRTAATMAILDAGIQLDDRAAKLEIPDPDRSRWFNPPFDGGGNSGHGVVRTVTASGKKLHIVFTPKMGKELQCAQSRSTGEVTRIEPTGQVDYRQVCVKTKLVTVNNASDPVDVDERYAAGVKAGAYIEVAVGVVEAVWSSSTSAIPSVVLGVPVK